MGLEKFKSGNTEQDTKTENPTPVIPPPEKSRACPECVEDNEWTEEKMAYECRNKDCPNKYYIRGFRRTPFFGSPLKTLYPSVTAEGKRNELYGGDKNDTEKIKEIEEKQEEEPEEYTTLDKW